jgi:hypothetical protein
MRERCRAGGHRRAGVSGLFFSPQPAGKGQAAAGAHGFPTRPRRACRSWSTQDGRGGHGACRHRAPRRFLFSSAAVQKTARGASRVPRTPVTAPGPTRMRVARAHPTHTPALHPDAPTPSLTLTSMSRSSAAGSGGGGGGAAVAGLPKAASAAPAAAASHGAGTAKAGRMPRSSAARAAVCGVRWRSSPPAGGRRPPPDGGGGASIFFVLCSGPD